MTVPVPTSVRLVGSAAKGVACMQADMAVLSLELRQGQRHPGKKNEERKTKRSPQVDVEDAVALKKILDY